MMASTDLRMHTSAAQLWAVWRAHVSLARCCRLWWNSSTWLNNALSSGRTSVEHKGQHIVRLRTRFETRFDMRPNLEWW